MDGYETLGYGTHVILDGFRAQPPRLGEESRVERVLREIGRLLGEAGGDVVVMRPVRENGNGMSAALIAGESHLMLHAFPGLHKLSLEVFSIRSLPMQAITDAFLEGFGVGRFECRIYGRGRLPPREREALQRALAGDRDYARLRLRDLLGA